MITRRKFVLSGLIAAGCNVFGDIPALAADCPVESINPPGPLPLNDILSDFQQEQRIGFGLKKVTICSKESWEDKRLNILQRSQLTLGFAPKVSGDTVKAEIIAENQRNGYKELSVKFNSGTGDVINGYLLVPDSTTSSSPRPAILAMHSTGPGADQTIGLVPKENRSYGMELAQRGYVVLAIDVISAGKRIYPGFNSYHTDEFYRQYPNWSAMDKIIHDHKKSLDYLCSLDIVDPNRLGCIGHSLGGYNAFFLNAFEPRLKAAVSSCGLSPMGGTNTPYQFARDNWFVHFNPMCREYIRAGMIPCDMHEIMALGAPRPFFNYTARQDTIYFPKSIHDSSGFAGWWKTVDKALSQVQKVYEILGASDNFIRKEDDGDHDFPPYIREQAYTWLDKMLKKN